MNFIQTTLRSLLGGAVQSLYFGDGSEFDPAVLAVRIDRTRVARAILYDISGNITVAGLAQEVLPFNGDRDYLFIQNVSAADIWINFNSPASVGNPSIKLLPNMYLEYTKVVPMEALSVISDTLAAAFTCKWSLNVS